MRKYIVSLMFLLLFSLGFNVSQSAAYSVKVEKDSMYADVIPSNIMKNVGAMFQKQVRKSMKYYDKYKDADNYTYISRIPDEYRDFIDIAKEIQDSDEVVIRYPFYIYFPGEEEYYGYICNSYYFIAEKNQQKLCIFSIDVDTESGKTRFSYDKMLDHYFSLDGNITEETLFYEINQATYAETPEKRVTVRAINPPPDDYIMEGSGADDTEIRQFDQKNYEEKKEVILSYLKDVQKGKIMKKAEEDIDNEFDFELEKEDEPINTEDLLDFSSGEDVAEDEGGSDGKIYLAVCAAVFCILVIVTMVYIRKQRQG